MLLIIFLGLIANLVLVCDGCDVGTSAVNYVDWNRIVGTWYGFWHSSDNFENNIKCVVGTYAPPVGNNILLTLEAYDISTKISVTMYGNATNWTSNTLDIYFQQPAIWNGRFYVIAIDYSSYIVVEMCSFQDNQLYTYVSFRSQQPDQDTVKEVENVLKEKNIDASQLAVWKTNSCQQGGS